MKGKRLGHGAVGRHVIIWTAQQRDEFAVFGSCYSREFKVKAVRERGGQLEYKLDDPKARYHYFTQAWKMPSPAALEKMLTVDPIGHQRVIEKALNPPIVQHSTPWFPKMALRFVRGNYDEKETRKARLVREAEEHYGEKTVADIRRELRAELRRKR